MPYKRKPHSQRKVYESGYGSFGGGDPRRFYPDPECSTDAERVAWQTACDAWNRGDSVRIPSAHEATGANIEAMTIVGGQVVHVTEERFGLGSYEYRLPIIPRWQRRIHRQQSIDSMTESYPDTDWKKEFGQHAL